MSASGMHRRVVIAGWILLGVLVAGTVHSAVPPAVGDTTAMLQHANDVKLSDQQQFQQILDRLGTESANLPPVQLEYLHYLQAWQAAYRGDYGTSDSLLEGVLNQSVNLTMRFRAGVLLVNTLAERSRYEEAFQRQSLLLNQLSDITDPDARAQALVVAAYLYEEAGQYDLAFSYADRVSKESPGAYSCKAEHARIGALYKSGRLQNIDEQFQQGINICSKAGDLVYANGIRFYVASLALRRNHVARAFQILKSNYAAVQSSKYQMLISEFDALLAEAYLSTNQLAQAKQSALAVVAQSMRNRYGESLSIAYRVLYLVEKRRGNMSAALTYHESYMEANKGYLNAVNARALAFQTVEQQVLAKKLQIDALSKQNEILQLQQTLDKKATETSRLYIILLATVLAFIAFWAYRIKRSQLRFMKLARRDGLTGIYNRQHFVNEVELQLKYCRKSAREACLVLLDLDHFKAVNDTHGHAVGDRVLKRAVAACQAHLRSSDIFGRLGGEEFGIMLPDCTLQQVLARVELMRHAIATAARGGETIDIPISASFGVASATHTGYELRELLASADDALYRAKREGRNRVSVSDGLAKPCLGIVGVATEGM
ncbi:MAG TPA: GGDEF domain-containing protein [Rhodanobacter sp.]